MTFHGWKGTSYKENNHLYPIITELMKKYERRKDDLLELMNDA